MKQIKSYLKVVDTRRRKIVLISIIGVLVLAISIVALAVKFDITPSKFGGIVKTSCTNLASWFKNLFGTNIFQYRNIVQIFVFAISGAAIFYFSKNKNIILLITSLFYGIIYFITFSGINLMNSYWFWILIGIAELIAIITSYISTGDSFVSCCESILFQLFVLVPVWFIMYCLCSYAAEKGNAELENLFYLILQFATFTVVLGYQLIMMFSNGTASIGERDPVADMTGDEIDNDDYLF